MSAIAVVLYRPEIPPNTGNIARTCAATGVPLILVGELGFRIDDRAVRRAGLDYWRHADVTHIASWEAYRESFPTALRCAFSTGGTRQYVDTPTTGVGPIHLLFGQETRGLPAEVIADANGGVYRIPLRSSIRSLNLSTAVGIALFDHLRRSGFPDLSERREP